MSENKYNVDVTLEANLGIEVVAEDEEAATDSAIEQLDAALHDLTDDIYIETLEIDAVEQLD